MAMNRTDILLLILISIFTQTGNAKQEIDATAEWRKLKTGIFLLPNGEESSYEGVLNHSNSIGIHKTIRLNEKNDVNTTQIAISNEALNQSINSAYFEYSFKEERQFEPPFIPVGLSPLPKSFEGTVKAGFYRLLLYQSSIDSTTDEMERVFVFDGAKSFNLSGKVGFIYPGRLVEYFLLAKNLMLTMKLFVTPESRAGRKTDSSYIPNLLKLPEEQMEIDTNLWSVNGHKCVCINFGLSVYWFDIAKPHSLRRRLVLSPSFADENGGIKPGAIHSLVEFDDFRQLENEQMLPFHSHVRLFYSETEFIEYGRLFKISEYRIKKFEVGDSVPMQLFEINIPPNTEVHDLVNGQRYVTPADANIQIQLIESSLKKFPIKRKLSFVNFFYAMGIVLCLVFSYRMISIK